MELVLAICRKTQFFVKLHAVQGCTGIFDGRMPLKMGVFRKPRFSKDDVEKAMDGFFQQSVSLESGRACSPRRH
jgi:hypothetical protein